MGAEDALPSFPRGEDGRLRPRELTELGNASYHPVLTVKVVESLLRTDLTSGCFEGLICLVIHRLLKLISLLRSCYQRDSMHTQKLKGRKQRKLFNWISALPQSRKVAVVEMAG